MPSKGTPVRTVRVPNELWDAAKDAAAQESETVGTVIVRSLEQYVRRIARKAEKR